MSPRKKPADTPKPKKAATAGSATSVESTRHQNKRTNIPTRELGAMAAADESAPKAVLYPRDPSLDPQLVWKGKDAQDREPLTVPAVPIYIQEKIHPQAIIEDLRARAAAGQPQAADLFADFNGLDDLQKKLEFYQHSQHWTNRLILGDSLLVMTSLAEKERLRGQVQCIYIDPPYGIKFGSNWQVSTRKRDVKDAKAEDLTRQPEQVKAFRDTWELGIHSYLTYLRDRLAAARELLTESGSVFVQIGDTNLHLVRSVLDEVFGSANFIRQVTVKKTTGGTADFIPGTCDYLLWYAKDVGQAKFRAVYLLKELGGAGTTGYTRVELPNGERRPLTGAEAFDPSSLPRGSRVYAADNLTSQSMGREKGEGAASWFPVKIGGEEYRPSMKARWKTNEQGMARLLLAKRVLVTGGEQLAYCRYFDDFPAVPLSDVWTDTVGQNQFGGEKTYVVQTALKVVERCLLMTTDPGDLVLDPTCGSGTTAFVAEQWGRRWITIDTSRVALALARTRLMAARFPYYLLADSTAGRKKEWEVAGKAPPANDPAPPPKNDIRRGFVYKTVPHVTLKSIANNPDIKEGMTRDQIDAAIRRHADTETLYDQPYEDKNTIRVCGPFTVESLSPHRMLPTAEAAKAVAAEPAPAPPTVQPGDESAFIPTIIDHLRKAGVQNTKKGERLEFDRLDPYPGEFLQAEGSYTEAGKPKRAVVCIGPEFGTVGPELLADAAREAYRGMGNDLLLVCGFAFDPHVTEEGKVIEKQVKGLRVVFVKMNPDLTMGDTLLKNTGAGNLFMVFGEPDLDIQKQKDGKLVVRVKGIDVFDPTTGDIRSGGPDDIACWFIDSDYDGNSFFVRHAYFLGNQDPYEKLKRALRAEVDEGEWSKLYSTESDPFDPPKKGKIAVKVINHYGDEVLKVYDVRKL